MGAKDKSRLVWSDEQGGAVGDKPLKHLRKKQKRNPAKQIEKSGFPKDGVIRVCREKSGRGGKTVTVLYGVEGAPAEKEKMLKALKQQCGCGGVLKGGFLEIQGDQREKILSWLDEQGLQAKKAGG